MVRALKILSKDKLDQVKLLEEMNILTQMDHPNIVKLYEVYEDDDSFYLVNEYCSGGEMLERLRK
jgi:calcium-dependent protein kinase